MYDCHQWIRTVSGLGTMDTHVHNFPRLTLQKQGKGSSKEKLAIHVMKEPR